MLVLLAALFAAPLAVSFVMYYGHSGLQPTRRVNHGDLLNPAVPLPPASLPLAAADADPTAVTVTAADFLRHTWTLVFVGDGACNERCRKALYDTRQVRIALDRDMVRVQRVFIATGSRCDLDYLRHEHPDLIVARAGDAAAPLLEIFNAADRAAGDAAAGAAGGRVYLVDPLSNLVLSYAADAPAKGLLEDLKRLLKLSQIG